MSQGNILHAWMTNVLKIMDNQSMRAINAEQVTYIHISTLKNNAPPFRKFSSTTPKIVSNTNLIAQITSAGHDEPFLDSRQS